MSGNVGTGLVESGMAENMGLGVGISTISHSRPEICMYFRFQLFISISGSRRVSDNVGTCLLETGMVENMGLGIVIPTISHSRPEICKYFRFQLVISISGSRRVSGNVGTGLVESGMVENMWLGVGISTISHSWPEI